MKMTVFGVEVDDVLAWTWQKSVQKLVRILIDLIDYVYAMSGVILICCPFQQILKSGDWASTYSMILQEDLPRFEAGLEHPNIGHGGRSRWHALLVA